MRRQVLEVTWEERIAPDHPLKFGDYPLERFDSKAVRILRNQKTEFPEAASVRVKAIRRVFKWAIDEEVGGLTTNPARDVSRFESKNPGGHHTWTLRS